LGYLLGKNFRRRDRDHLVPPRRMDAAVCRAEVCYPFGREHARHWAVRRREFITPLLASEAVSVGDLVIFLNSRGECPKKARPGAGRPFAIKV